MSVPESGLVSWKFGHAPGLQRWQAARVSQKHGTGRVGSGLRDLKINGLFDFRHWPALACWIANLEVIVIRYPNRVTPVCDARVGT